MPPDAFVANFENKVPQTLSSATTYHIVSSFDMRDKSLSLARWKPAPIPALTKTVTVLSDTDLAMLLSERENLSLDQKLLVVTTYPPIDGMKELIAQWRSSGHNHVNLVMVNHNIAKEQSTVQVPDIDLAFNVLQHVSFIKSNLSFRSFCVRTL